MADQRTPQPIVDRRGSSWIDNQPFALMMVITIGLFTCIGLLIFRGLPVENHDAIVSVTSAVTTVWIAGGAFFFGSSVNANANSKALANIAAAVPASPASQVGTTTTTVVPANTTTTTVVEPAAATPIVAPATKPAEGPGSTLPPTPGEVA